MSDIGVPETRRPEHPDGTKYAFDCCAVPEVQRFMPNPIESGREVSECVNCGYDWTEELDD